MRQRAFIAFLFFLIGCNASKEGHEVLHSPKGAMVATRMKCFDDLLKNIQIEYSQDSQKVVLKRQVEGFELRSVLKSGLSEKDFQKARKGSFWNKLVLGFFSPYAVSNRKNLIRIYALSRRNILGGGDLAFYDLAESMFNNINDDDFQYISSEDLSDKGYINTLNHITAQALATSLISEKFADFIADIHERANMPELISGKFEESQLWDLENGPIDNYVDMLNNELGQEIGNLLKEKYRIDLNFLWTPELLAAYLNDLQTILSRDLKIGFKPFLASDRTIIKFAEKINRMNRNTTGLH